jgi:hypothetical protein
MNLSKNLTLSEAIRSETAKRNHIDNTPNEEQLQQLKITAEKIFQPIRDHFGRPIYITSMFRCEKLNTWVKGAEFSAHKHINNLGAIDIDMDGTEISNKEVFDFIRNNLDFDVLIWEYGTKESPAWVHCSYHSGRKNRKYVLQMYRDENGISRTIEYKDVKPREEKKETPKRDKGRSATSKVRSNKQST